MNNKNIIKFMGKRDGYATTSEILDRGAHFAQLEQLLEEDKIERIKRGLYRLKDDSFTPIREFVDTCRAIPRAVICLYSALSYYELTTFAPTEMMIAIPQGYHAPKIKYPPLQVFHFSKKQYEAGIDIIKDNEGTYKIYSPEKSVCDAFRFRKKLGDDTAKEVLFNYLESKERNLRKLLDIAEVCRTYNIMKPYIEAKIG